MKEVSWDISVVGGGVVGLAAALGMVQRGYSVALIDGGPLMHSQDESSESTLRVFAINQASQRLLHALGVWQLLNEHQLSAYQHMLIRDAVSESRIEFDAQMIAHNYLGFIIAESALREALLQRLRDEENVSLFPETRIDSIREDSNYIELLSGKEVWSTRLLIATDGANSVCRSLLKVPMTIKPYHQHALIAQINTERPHHKTAYQVFQAEGPVALLPLTDPHQCSLVWTTTPDRAQELIASSEASFNETLRAAFLDQLGALQVNSSRQQFPLVMRHVHQYTGAHWVLFGDAAHTIHPLAGLGLNLGLADVAAWFSVCDKTPARLPGKIQRGAYQRQRKQAVWQVIVLMQALNTIFSSTLAPIRFLRGFGLQCGDRLLGLKRLLIDYASG